MNIAVFVRAVALLLVTALLGACATRSHIRGCELAHPYHQAPLPNQLVLADGLQAPRTKAIFHVPEQRHLAPKPADLLVEADVEALDKEALMAKRCIVSPPRLPAPAEADSEMSDQPTTEAPAA